MSRSRFTPRQMATAGIIAAIYAALTLLLPLPQYGPVQFRLAEAMTVLPFLFPEAVPGLTVGCFLANLLGSPMPVDWIVGTAATLLAALWTSRLRHRALAPLPPVICNMVLVGAELALFYPAEGMGFWAAYGFNALTVGIGEAAACFILGTLLLTMVTNSLIMLGIPIEWQKVFVGAIIIIGTAVSAIQSHAGAKVKTRLKKEAA